MVSNIKRKAQAAAEMAIFGTLILIAFNLILTYGQRIDSIQNTKMEAFRKALQMAYQENSAVTYTVKKNSRIVDLFSGFGNGQPGTASASASVMWQKGMSGKKGTEGDNGFTYYQIDNRIFEFRPEHDKKIITKTGQEQDIKTPDSVWREEATRITSYDSEVVKDENDGSDNIINKKTVRLNDTLETNLYLRWDERKYDQRVPADDKELPDYNYKDTPQVTTQGAYVENNRIAFGEDKVGETVSKQRTWTTAQ